MPETIASASLRPPRPDLGPNQLAWLERKVRAFRPCRKAARRAIAQAQKAEAKARGQGI